MKYILMIAIMLCCCSLRAQSNDELYAGFSVGGGNGAQAGVVVGDYNKVRRGPFYTGGFLELGLIGPVRKSPADGLFSVNYESAFSFGARQLPERSILPFATIGYSRLFQAGNAINYGGGLVIRRLKRDSDGCASALKVEFRDYWIPGQGHSYALRLWRQKDLQLDEC